MVGQLARAFASRHCRRDCRTGRAARTRNLRWIFARTCRGVLLASRENSSPALTAHFFLGRWLDCRRSCAETCGSVLEKFRPPREGPNRRAGKCLPRQYGGGVVRKGDF